VKSHISEDFRAELAKLPAHVQRHAREAYKLFAMNPYHASLRFKQVHPTKPIYSVRIGRGYRALGELSGEEVIWFWIGSHAEYDKVLDQL
jgi:mRNA-degrading endonuclease RelE of RelBE toxin-antitoxin system